MINFIFTHDSTEDAIRTRDTLHNYLKGSKAYVDSKIILSDGSPDCESGEWTQTFRNDETKEDIKYEHCISLLVGTDSEKVGDTLYQIIHVYENELDEQIGTMKLFLKS